MNDYEVLIKTARDNVLKWVNVENCLTYRDAIAEAEARTGGKYAGNWRVLGPHKTASEKEYWAKKSAKSGTGCVVPFAFLLTIMVTAAATVAEFVTSL